MEKRVLAAVLLSFIVLYAYQALVPAPKRPVRAKTAATESTSPEPAPAPPEAAGQAAMATEPASPLAPAGQPAASPASVPAPTVAAPGGRSIVLSTNLVRAVFSNEGGVLTSWTLKHYTDHAGKAVDLVPEGLPASEARPFSLRLPDLARTAELNQALFQTSAPDELTVKDRPVTLEFDYADASGFRAHKEFRIEPNSYLITFSIDVADGSATLNPAVQWGPGPGDEIYVAGRRSFGSYAQPPQAILYAEGSVKRLPEAKVLAQPTWQGDFPFAGIDDHYFLASLVKPGTARVAYKPATVPIAGQPDAKRELMAFEVVFASPPKDKQVFFGPKDFDVMAAIDRDLVRTIYYGIFSFLAVPLLHALKWINGFIGNYGWSIIVLTLFINVLMFPLRHRSVVSMRKMQQLQPQVKEIQNRYAKLKMTDPGKQKMNEELMQLYREKGVNPASGCVPMLLTMPILFAFYAMLSVSIELRGQPFALWIQDLSQHDPYYITPVLMGITMLWQQRLTPVADPAQAKVMMITPIMFLVFFLWAPSGLVIYWLMSNLLGIGQQYATNRIVGGPPLKARAPADRKIKQAGAGQTDGARGNGQ
jgi:YidC/Oxa1 family membrane protein insertase